MTNEQWLVYIWSIYPTGGFSILWGILLLSVLTFILIFFIFHQDKKIEDKKYTTWTKLGKLKWIIPLILSILLFMSNLVPNRDGFMYILATPYIVDSGKSLLDSLNDEHSKLYKLNQIIDGSLDKAIKAISEDTNMSTSN